MASHTRRGCREFTEFDSGAVSPLPLRPRAGPAVSLEFASLCAARADIYGEKTSRSHVLVDVAFLEQAPDRHTRSLNWTSLRGRGVLVDLHGAMVSSTCCSGTPRTQIARAGVTEALRSLRIAGHSSCASTSTGNSTGVLFEPSHTSTM
jgi:hypothetical protein